MGLAHEHELHKRRLGRNVGLGVVLGAFVVLVFALTVVKMKSGDDMQGFDHRQPTPSATTPEAGQ